MGTDVLHPAGDTGVDVGAVLPVCSGDALAQKHAVTHIDQRNGWGAGAHIQREIDPLGGGLKGAERLASGIFFAGGRVDPTKK
jgi:hypothetical protein